MAIIEASPDEVAAFARAFIGPPDLRYISDDARKWRHLMSVPANNPDRDKLRDRVPYSAKRLESMTRHMLSRSPEFQRANPLQVHERPAPKCSVVIAAPPKWWHAWCNQPCRCGSCAICLARPASVPTAMVARAPKAKRTPAAPRAPDLSAWHKPAPISKLPDVQRLRALLQEAA